MRIDGAGQERGSRRGIRLPRLHRARDEVAAISYARPTDPLARRALIRSLEMLSGRRELERLYRQWRERVALGHPQPFHLMLETMRIGLDIGGSWPLRPGELPERLVMVANHPFGIGDGAAMLALAERLGRPARILLHNDLMQIPEMARYGLPVSFEETREAVALNLATKRRAAELLAEGTIVIVFPAGAVATAPRPFGRAEDLPWKTFAAGLVRGGRAGVLPVHCAGQNGPLFHLASRVSATVRLGLLVGEFRRLRGRQLRITVGRPIAPDEIGQTSDRLALTEQLRRSVLALG
ncbi:glycerol acyltransferase [Aureimonas sp. AU4]|uniref:glycerol acyltransferase n=1 Tax=Aureimonas sp. AU4 TaxID=1638163 RepID=UPI000AEA87AB|nr:glycerol acyltransferase [Aureimonas sp. AU4]